MTNTLTSLKGFDTTLSHNNLAILNGNVETCSRQVVSLEHPTAKTKS